MDLRDAILNLFNQDEQRINRMMQLLHSLSANSDLEKAEELKNEIFKMKKNKVSIEILREAEETFLEAKNKTQENKDYWSEKIEHLENHKKRKQRNSRKIPFVIPITGGTGDVWKDSCKQFEYNAEKCNDGDGFDEMLQKLWDKKTISDSDFLDELEYIFFNQIINFRKFSIYKNNTVMNFIEKHRMNNHQETLKPNVKPKPSKFEDLLNCDDNLKTEIVNYIEKNYQGIKAQKASLLYWALYKEELLQRPDNEIASVLMRLLYPLINVKSLAGFHKEIKKYGSTYKDEDLEKIRKDLKKIKKKGE